MTRYWHGGAPGLRLGDLILPPEVTGAHSCADFGAEGVTRRDRVYITTAEAAARMYAAYHPSGRGVVYEVEPIGELENDPDYDLPGLSFECKSALVIRATPLSSSAIHRIRRAVQRAQ